MAKCLVLFLRDVSLCGLSLSQRLALDLSDDSLHGFHGDFSCSIAVAIVVEVAKADKEKQAAGEKDEEQGK